MLKRKSKRNPTILPGFSGDLLQERYRIHTTWRILTTVKAMQMPISFLFVRL
jgi:hypothetical protein